jgi:hypothetical protein
METAKYYGHRIRAYVDMHAHSQIPNTFTFANKHPDVDI